MRLSKLNFFQEYRKDGFGNALVVAKDLARMAAVRRSGYGSSDHSPDLSTHAAKTLVNAFIL